MTWREATVTAVVAASPHAVTITFDVPGWPGHRAGQHVDVRLTAEDGYQAQRSYSIASPPEQAAIELTVERVDDGEVSPYLAGELRAGDVVELRGPVGGHFSWSVADGGPLLLLAGGSGLVPLMSMLRHREAQGSSVEATLLVSVRTAPDLLYREELRRLAADERLDVAITYTREPPPGWTGRRGRIDAAMLAGIGAGVGSRCFVCGPTPFVEHVADLLIDTGHDYRDIHAERFGPTGG